MNNDPPPSQTSSPEGQSSEQPPEQPQAQQRGQGVKLLVDYGPVLVFFLLYHYLRRENSDTAIFDAAKVYMVVAVLALAWSRMKLGKFSGILLFTTVIIAITVFLALYSGNPIFFYMKPTVVNILFGVGVIGGVLFKKNVIKTLMGEMVDLPQKAWNNLAIRWGIFFFVLAGINEIVWRNFSEDFWVNFKLFGFLPISLAFTLSQVPYLLKHNRKDLT